MDRVQRLPIPYWLTYTLAFILQGLILYVIAWTDGSLDAYAFSPILLLFPIWLWGGLTIMTYLDAYSIEALSSFRSLLDIDQAALDRLKVEFITMPARNVVISGLVWSLIYAFITYGAYEALCVANGLRMWATTSVVLSGLISFSMGSALYYHSFRQLRLINRTVKKVKHFNLFRLDPVYAFSGVTARTGIAWVILLSLTLVILPIETSPGPILVILTVQLSMAMATFVLPLWIVNHRLVEEKRGLLAAINERLESTLDRMHGYLDLSGFLSAVLLPIILFLAQLALGRWLEG